MVHHEQRFQEITLSFPIRGYSYMESDRDMACVNQKLQVEIPSGWREHFCEARLNPSPFNVVTVDKDMLMDVEKHLKSLFRATCPVKTQPLREVVFTRAHPRMIHYRENWNDSFLSTAVALPVGKKRDILPPLAPLKTDVVPITEKKFNDLQVLQTFCLSQEAQENYKSLRHSGHAVAPMAP